VEKSTFFTVQLCRFFTEGWHPNYDPIVTRGYFGPSKINISYLCTVNHNIMDRLGSLFSEAKKQNLFITPRSHFRTFQSLKISIFQDKSWECCHTLLYIDKYKTFYFTTIKGSLRNLIDLDSLQSGLYTVQELSYSNCY
jgi:hypothetical protein